MITLKELRDWVSALPKEFDDFSCVHSTEVSLEDEFYYRADDPFTSLGIDTDTKEAVFGTPFRGDLNDLKDEKN